jgi:hypothetical protein
VRGPSPTEATEVFLSTCLAECSQVRSEIAPRRKEARQGQRECAGNLGCDAVLDRSDGVGQLLIGAERGLHRSEARARRCGACLDGLDRVAGGGCLVLD